MKIIFVNRVFSTVKEKPLKERSSPIISYFLNKVFILFHAIYEFLTTQVYTLENLVVVELQANLYSIMSYFY
jgi:hypothetical protein